MLSSRLLLSAFNRLAVFFAVRLDLENTRILNRNIERKLLVNYTRERLVKFLCVEQSLAAVLELDCQYVVLVTHLGVV